MLPPGSVTPASTVSHCSQPPVGATVAVESTGPSGASTRSSIVPPPPAEADNGHGGNVNLFGVLEATYTDKGAPGVDPLIRSGGDGEGAIANGQITISGHSSGSAPLSPGILQVRADGSRTPSQYETRSRSGKPRQAPHSRSRSRARSSSQGPRRSTPSTPIGTPA
jgi:hypothetical protein